MQMSAMIILLNEMIVNCGSSGLLMDHIVLFVATEVAFVKTIAFRANIASVYSMLESSHIDWVNEILEYVPVQRKFAQIGRRLFFIQSSNAALLVISLNLTAVVSKNFTKNEEKYLPEESICTFGDLTGLLYSGVFFFQMVQVNREKSWLSLFVFSRDIFLFFADAFHSHRSIFLRRLLDQFYIAHLRTIGNPCEEI